MKLERSFEVQAPIEAVWPALNDLERVAPCMPGAAITGRDADGTHHCEFTLRLGPLSSVHRGTVRIEAANETSRTATLVASGAAGTGNGATVVYSLTDLGDATRVDAIADLAVNGGLASFSGLIADITSRLLRDFAICLARQITGAAPDAEAAAG